MSSTVRFLASLGCAGLAAAASHPAETSAHAHGRMDPQRVALAEFGADAAFDARGVLWAVHKVSGHIAVSRSTNRGDSWSSPVLVTPAPESTDPGGDARPKIALGRTGEIYVTWTKPLDEPFSGEIKFSRSLDGGRTFLPAKVVHRDRQVITHRFDTIAVNASGQLFVAWIDKRDLTAAKANNLSYRGAAVYFAVSDDSGATFRGDYKAADHSCECCRIALAPRGDGTIAAMWRHIFVPNVRDHAVATLRPDGTVTGAGRASFEDWRLDACPHHGPAIDVDAAGRVHAVWFSAADESRGIFYGRLRASGADGWRKIGSPPASHPDIAVDGRRVAIAWKIMEGTGARLRGTISEDEGASWKEFDLHSTAGASDHPKLLVQDGEFFVFWNTQEHPLAVTRFSRGGTAIAPASLKVARASRPVWKVARASRP